MPQEDETTAVAFGYDAPGSEPPQAILLAVPPDARAKWSVEALEEIVGEALDLARVRLVDVDSLRELGHFLPAVWKYAVSPEASTGASRPSERPKEL